MTQAKAEVVDLQRIANTGRKEDPRAGKNPEESDRGSYLHQTNNRVGRLPSRDKNIKDRRKE